MSLDLPTAKVCFGCKQEFLVTPDNFHYRDKQHTKLGSYCRVCHNKQTSEWARNNKEKRALQTSALMKFNRTVRDLARAAPCTDCGGRFPACAMDWDHVNNDKKYNVAAMMTYKPSQVFAEITKCELVCATCHRIRTFNRQYKGE